MISTNLAYFVMTNAARAVDSSITEVNVLEWYSLAVSATGFEIPINNILAFNGSFECTEAVYYFAIITLKVVI